MTIIEHAIAGAVQGAWNTAADASGNVTDMTYAIFDGSGSQLTLTTYELIEGALHSDSATRSTMGRKTIQTALAIDKFGGPDSCYLGFGLPDTQAITPLAQASGWPLILDNTSTGEELVAIAGFYTSCAGGTNVLTPAFKIITERSSLIDDNATIDDPLPFTLTMTSDYNSGASKVIGPSSSGISSKTQGDFPTLGTVDFGLDDPNENYFSDITPVKLLARGDFLTGVNTLTANPSPHPYASPDLAAFVDTSWKVLALINANIFGASAFDISSVVGDVITLGSDPGTATSEPYFLIENHYTGTASGGSDEYIDDSGRGAAGTAWNESAFTDLVDTGEWAVYNLTTGFISKIYANEPGNSNTATRFYYGGTSAEVVALNPGIRSGVRDIGFQSGDVYLILPLITVTATYTDPAASSGGGGSTRIIDHNIIG